MKVFAKWRTFICNRQERNEYFISKIILPSCVEWFIGSLRNTLAPSMRLYRLCALRRFEFLVIDEWDIFFLFSRFAYTAFGNSQLQSLSRLASWHLLQYMSESNEWHFIDVSPFQLDDWYTSTRDLWHHPYKKWEDK